MGGGGRSSDHFVITCLVEQRVQVQVQVREPRQVGAGEPQESMSEFNVQNGRK